MRTPTPPQRTNRENSIFDRRRRCADRGPLQAAKAFPSRRKAELVQWRRSDGVATVSRNACTVASGTGGCSVVGSGGPPEEGEWNRPGGHRAATSDGLVLVVAGRP
jgi:hypothetical protein